MLYNLARKGEIDPLNIDVVEVADKFLEELEKARKLDLRISGRVLLYAAILVRMKSDIITSEATGIVDNEEEEEYPEIDYEYGFDSYHDHEYFEHTGDFEEFLSQEFLHDGDMIEDELISALVEAGRKRVRRYTTLEDLIRELESAERVRKRRRRKRRAEKEHVIDPMEVPHDENLEEIIEKVREVVMKMMKNRDIVRLGEIAGFDLVSKYISVLHLAFRRVFEIRQERIFESDIEIRRVDHERED